ncbi:MAG: aminopeptidase N [Gammaproteobacteria bacterium]|nr:aminopeptidase N [Gammaproteobacteria bacterium]
MDIKTASQTPPTPKTVYLKDYQAPAYWIDQVSLEFDLSASNTTVTSHLMLRRNPEIATLNTPLRLDGNDLTLRSVAIDGKSLATSRYQMDAERLVITDVPATFTLTTVVTIKPDENTALEGLYHSGKMLCTQCEAEGFRRITYFIDRPDVMSRYRVTLRADKSQYPILLSNGNLIEQGELADGRHYACWDDPSLKPCYLFALVAGDLQFVEDHFITMSGRRVTLRLYTEVENIHKCAHAMRSLKQAMAWDEKTYGREYDLDIFMIVAVNDFNMGAMENKGLNIFNSACVLARPETATDDDYYSIQSIVGHEYFHNWSGNRVTCRDWFQLSLKEGFTVFRDQEFSSDMNSRGVKRIDDVNVLRNAQFAEDSSPMAHPVRPDRYMEISNFYTVTVYNKGAEVVRMLRNLVGAEGFRRGTDLYFKRHDGQAVTTEEFVRAMEAANNKDFTPFRRWYDQAGTPLLQVRGDYDPVLRQYRLQLQQSCPSTPNQAEKLPFHIPVTLGLIAPNGDELPLRLQGEASAGTKTRVLEINAAKHEFVFEDIPAKPVPSLLRGFSAPVKLAISRGEDELAFLLAHDSDAFNRWDAGQLLAQQELLRQIAAYQRAEPMPEPVTLTDALRQVLRDQSIDKMLLSQILTLPAEGYLADQMPVVDVDAIFQARLFTRRYLARHLQPEFDRLYLSNHRQATYEFNSATMAERALKNVCLGYLLETEQPLLQERAYKQYQLATNMTDRQAALSGLCQFDINQRQHALTDFYQRFQHDPLVVDKWFGLQARSRLANTFERVKELMTHPAFSLKNPNKVRSLITSFCAGNPLRFHRQDGAGYAFLTEQILVLDKLNPQIASRLAKIMSRWRRYDPQRQILLRNNLERIAAVEGLSKDVYEVVSKSLTG